MSSDSNFDSTTVGIRGWNTRCCSFVALAHISFCQIACDVSILMKFLFFLFRQSSKANACHFHGAYGMMPLSGLLHDTVAFNLLRNRESWKGLFTVNCNLGPMCTLPADDCLPFSCLGEKILYPLDTMPSFHIPQWR